MRIYQASCVAVAAAIALTLTAPIASAQVEQIEPVTLDVGVLDDEPTQLTATAANSFYDRIDQVEYKLAMLETRPAPQQGSCNQCPIPSRRIATNSLRNPRTYAGFELAILKPYTSSLSVAIPPIPLSVVLTPEYDFETSPRVYIGRERCDGLGVRATYWQFDHGTDDAGIAGTTTGLEMHALDLEITNHVEFCGSDVMLSAGLRYADLESNVNVPALGGSLQLKSDGVGPTIAASLRRNSGRPNLDFVVGGRGSLVLTDTTFGIPTLISLKGSDSTLQIWEARMGVEYARQIRGMHFVSQVVYEAQNWQTGSIAGLISPNVGLGGPTFRVGLNF